MPCSSQVRAACTSYHFASDAPISGLRTSSTSIPLPGDEVNLLPSSRTMAGVSRRRQPGRGDGSGEDPRGLLRLHRTPRRAASQRRRLRSVFEKGRRARVTSPPT